MGVTMFRILRLLILSAIFLLAACEVKRPENVLPPEKMEAFLYDYHLVQSMSAEYSSSSNKEKIYFDYVFRKHGVTQADFDTAMVWYNRFPKHMQKIYANLEKRLEAEVQLLDNAHGSLEEGVSIEVVDLAPKNAELWTSSTIRLLSPNPLCNKVVFSFETPGDSSFVAGDSLNFSFSTIFLTGRNGDVDQNIYASITLDYEDGTYEGAGLDVKATGKYSLAVPRNKKSRLKSMSGFIYYTDNDSASTSRAVVNRISLRRMHVGAGKSAKKK